MFKYIKTLFILLILSVSIPINAEQIQSLKEYFEYLPNEVHKNWIPYKSEKEYSVVIQFRVNKKGEISNPEIVSSTNKYANDSVLKAVKKGAPYLPLPDSFLMDSVKAQVELRYIK